MMKIKKYFTFPRNLQGRLRVPQDFPGHPLNIIGYLGIARSLRVWQQSILKVNNVAYEDDYETNTYIIPNYYYDLFT